MAYDIKQEWWDDVGRGAKGGPKQGTPKAKVKKQPPDLTAGEFNRSE